MKKSSGFSLVELSIVLVILGLLVGGILAGRSLIRAAELRGITTEYTRYYTTVHAFQNKYFARPGDFYNATRFWSTDSAPASCTTNSSAPLSANGVCDGNGDNILTYGGSNTINIATEVFQFWRHLEKSGMIEGTYTGVTYMADDKAAAIGVSVPGSKYPGAGWGVMRSNAGAAENITQAFTLPRGYPENFFVLGKEITLKPPQDAVLKPEEAWNIDTKVDDGKPGQGNLLAFSRANWGNSASCTNGADTNDLTTDYRVSSQNVGCALFFIKLF